jgi:hypothetical protein
MKVLRARCSGLDVHKESVVASVRLQRGSEALPKFQTGL